MDSSLLLMLSSLLHLHNHLDPAAADSSPSSSSSPLSSSAGPLLFFALASVLSSALHGSRRLSFPFSSPTPSPSPPPRSRSLFACADRALSLDPSARDARWRALHGLSHPAFHSLLAHLQSHPLPLSLPPDRALSLALARLSRGASPASLARPLALSPAFVSRATHAVTRLLSTRLYPAYVKPPLSSRLLRTLRSFRDLSHLLNLAGALLSSPVRLRLPRDYPSDSDPHALFSPHRPFPSVLLQAVADPRKIFWDVCVRAPGATHPTDHLRDSRLYARLADGDLLPDAPVTIRGLPVRPYLVAPNPSFPLLPFLLTPFGPNSTSGPADEMFDQAMEQAHMGSAGAAVALLKGRWRILRNLNVGLDHAAQTVVACCVLHNMCQADGEPEDGCLWHDPPEHPPPPARVTEGERAMHQAAEGLRRVLADDLYERQQWISRGGGAR